MAIDKAVDSAQLDSDLATVADAIRLKGGTSAPLAFPAGYAQAIAALPDAPTLITKSIDTNGTYSAASDSADGYSEVTVNVSGGGPTPSAERKDVNFLDYDGTILYSYTAQEAAALDALPANPSHSGLTAQGWNYTLAQMKAEVTAQGKCDIGQMYVPDDGKTRLYIHIPEGTTGTGLTFYVRYTQTVSNGVTVDWGDGNSETFSGTSAANRGHTYATAGDYVVTLNVTSGSVSFSGSSSNAIYGSASSYYNRTRIVKAEIGKNVTSIGNYAFYCCCALKSITIPSNVTDIGTYAFDYCYALKSITIPSNVTSIGNYMFDNCNALKSITIPSSVTSIGNYAFCYCYALAFITIPSGITSIGSHVLEGCHLLEGTTLPSSITSIEGDAFRDCYCLRYATIPSNVTSIGNNVFYNCYALKSIMIPSEVTSIGNFAIYSCYGLGKIHFKPTTPPTVSGSSAFSNLPRGCTIYVPYSADHSVLNLYKGATNYPSSSTYTYLEE